VESTTQQSSEYYMMEYARIVDCIMLIELIVRKKELWVTNSLV